MTCRHKLGRIIILIRDDRAGTKAAEAPRRAMQGRLLAVDVCEVRYTSANPVVVDGTHFIRTRSPAAAQLSMCLQLPVIVSPVTMHSYHRFLPFNRIRYAT